MTDQKNNTGTTGISSDPSDYTRAFNMAQQQLLGEVGKGVLETV